MSLYAVGDIHGNVDNAHCAIDPMLPSLTESDTIVLLGDVGIRYGDNTHGTLRKYLSRLPCTVLVLRGNHDVRYWRDALWGDFGRGHIETIDWQGNVVLRDDRYRNVLYLPDGGGLLTIDGHVCLAIPGAWSIDKEYRLEMGMPWEPEEQLTTSEMSQLLALAESHPIEHIFSHTCPQSWLRELDDLLFPSDMAPPIDDAMPVWMDDVLEACDSTLEGWWFGHFHDDRDVAFGLGHLLYHDARKVF